MTILILGATGFIGQAVAQAMSARGAKVIGAGRTVGNARARYPEIKWVTCDLSKMTNPQDWISLLPGVKFIMNCAGVLQDGLRDDLVAVQTRSMLAMQQAFAKLNAPPLIIQISAPEILSAASTKFIDTKLQADRALARHQSQYPARRKFTCTAKYPDIRAKHSILFQ